MSSTVAGEPVCLERGEQDATVATVVADSGQEVRTGQWDKNSHKNSWSLCEETSRVCDHFGEAVDSTVDHGLLVKVQIHDRDGMSPIKPVVMVQGASDCSSKTGDYSTSENMKYSASVGEVVHPSGDSASARVDVESVECGYMCQNFGRLFESTTVVEETEVHRSCKQYPDLSQVVSAANSAVGADDVLRRREASRNGRDSTLPSAEVIDNGRIGDGARPNRPTSAITIVPHPFVGVEGEENYEEFEDEENCEEFESEEVEENYGEAVLLMKLLSGLFDAAGSNNIEEDYEESKLLNNGTMNATWLSRPVGVEAWLDRPANNYKESELLNIRVELDRKESGSEDVGDVADIKGAKDVKGVADVRKDCSEKREDGRVRSEHQEAFE